MAKFKAAFKLIGQFSELAHENRAYWIVPLFLLLAAIGIFIVAGQSAAPLIYALF